MSITLKPEQEQFIRDQVARGRFRSADEVLAQAFKLLEEKYQEYETWIEETYQQVDEAAAELDRGEGMPLETVMEQLQTRFRQARAAME
ncbi:ribbon-helix-helix domain-containing protein [Pantanalinema rosaneae CENA516]|uniref:ribbon-helix-helix domain-containing protein n=1 Tax=Pantanalinema rosaneae TaxID=1620701 RepID=UPI003D6FA87A